MLELIDSIWTFIGALITLIILGLIAGFSPTLYATQVGIAATSKRAQSLMIALMIGVLLGIVVLTIFFQFFQVETLRHIIDSTLKAVYVSAIFNIIIGAAFIAGGFWYIHKKPNRIAHDNKVALKSGYWALISLGFFRTFVSVSGATAIFLASTLASSSNPEIVIRLIFIAVFLAASIAPFVLILITMRQQPDKIQVLIDWFKSLLHKFDYKLFIGMTAILAGSSIVIFNLLRVTFQ